jgi:hypothetical protein
MILVNQKGKKEEHIGYQMDNLINNLTIVSALGFSIVMLGSIRLWSTDFNKSILLGISIASLIFVLCEYLKFGDRLRSYFQVLAISSIVCIPYIPFFINMDENMLAILNESFALFALGLSISVISRRGVRETSAIFKEISEDWSSVSKDINEIKMDLNKNTTDEFRILRKEVERIRAEIDKLELQAKHENHIETNSMENK